MDDIIKLIIILFIFVFGGTQLYCNLRECNADTNKISIVTVFGMMYVLNIYFVIDGFSKYKRNDLWKVVGFLVIIPYVFYKRLCEDKCDEMFYPALFIALPCVMIILNIYFLWANNRESEKFEKFTTRKLKHIIGSM